LRGEAVLKRDEASLISASEFMGFESAAEFSVQVERMRTGIKELSVKYLRDA
jgi:hypothetical protein